jgi:hypothetical protein
MAGADLLDSAWKYVPDRRLADFIAQSLLQSLMWTVFEPNDETLCASIRLEVTAFMNYVFGRGAFGPATAAAAYQVVCDATTTTAADQQRVRGSATRSLAGNLPCHSAAECPRRLGSALRRAQAPGNCVRPTKRRPRRSERAAMVRPEEAGRRRCLLTIALKYRAPRSS